MSGFATPSASHINMQFMQTHTTPPTPDNTLKVYPLNAPVAVAGVSTVNAVAGDVLLNPNNTISITRNGQLLNMGATGTLPSLTLTNTSGTTIDQITTSANGTPTDTRLLTEKAIINAITAAIALIPKTQYYEGTIPLAVANAPYPSTLSVGVFESYIWEGSTRYIKRNIRTIANGISVTNRLSDTPSAYYALPSHWVRKYGYTNPAVPIMTDDNPGGRGFITTVSTGRIVFEGIMRTGSFYIFNFEMEDIYSN